MVVKVVKEFLAMNNFLGKEANCVSEHLNFEIEQSDIIDENPDSQFATAKVRVFSSGESRNDTYCSEEVLQATAHTIDNKPIVYNVDNIFGDFGSHVDPSKTLIAGFAVPGSQKFERLPDGRLSLSILARLWKRYSPAAMEIFKRDGGRKKISVEIDLLDGEENPNGIKNMKDFVYSAICVLGDLVTEASPGAQLEMMSFAEENKKYKEAVALEFGSYEDVDFTIPPEVKKNVSKGLELYKQYNKGATSVSLASARHIIKNDVITPEKVRHIAKIHKSNKFTNMTKNPPSENWISYMLYGGKEGMNWSMEVSNKLDEQDSKELSYFGEVLTFPYKSKEDINPSLKGIDPPISVKDGNEIAKQADAIGGEYGWPTAIKSWKNRHKVVDGRWVKKENMSYDFSLNSAQVIEVLNNSLSEFTYGENNYRRYWVLAYDSDDNFVFIADSLENRNYRAKYNLTGNKGVIDLDSKEEVINAGWLPVKENINMEEEKKKEEMATEIPKEEEMAIEEPEKKEEEMAAEEPVKESPEEEKKEEEKEKEEMSLDQNLDVAAILAMLANETDAYSSIVKEEYAKEEKNFAKMFEAMCGKMSKMAEENKQLKSFKEDVEKRQFDFSINSTMKDIEEHSTMPQDKKDYLMEESKKFNLETVDAWRNLAKAEAFEFSIKSEDESKELRFANPWGTKDSTKKSSLWD
jgi:hypothetical protein